MYKEERYNNAIHCYKHALEIEPNFAPAYIGQGAAFFKTENFVEAAAAFEKALRLNPNDKTAADYLALTRQIDSKSRRAPSPTASRDGKPEAPRPVSTQPKPGPVSCLLSACITLCTYE